MASRGQRWPRWPCPDGRERRALDAHQFPSHWLLEWPLKPRGRRLGCLGFYDCSQDSALTGGFRTAPGLDSGAHRSSKCCFPSCWSRLPAWLPRTPPCLAWGRTVPLLTPRQSRAWPPGRTQGEGKELRPRTYCGWGWAARQGHPLTQCVPNLAGLVCSALSPTEPIWSHQSSTCLSPFNGGN